MRACSHGAPMQACTHARRRLAWRQLDGFETYHHRCIYLNTLVVLRHRCDSHGDSLMVLRHRCLDCLSALCSRGAFQSRVCQPSGRRSRSRRTRKTGMTISSATSPSRIWATCLETWATCSRGRRLPSPQQKSLELVNLKPETRNSPGEKSPSPPVFILERKREHLVTNRSYCKKKWHSKAHLHTHMQIRVHII